MGDYLLNMIMVAIMALPFVLFGGAVVDFLHSRPSKRERD